MNAPARNQTPALVGPMSTGQADINRIEKVGDIFKVESVKQRLKQIAPRHMNPERLLRVLAQALRTTPKLAECDPMSLLGALMTCAYVGLEPNTPLGHAYLIPFEKKRRNPQTKQWETERVDVNLIFGYRGLIDLARRGGELVSIHADVVYEGDEFEFEYGSNMHLRHMPKGDSEGRKPKWAYCHAKLKDGEAFEVLPYERVLKIRNSTQAYQAALKAKEDAEQRNQDWRMRAHDETPWVRHEHEMAAKTMVRRTAKWLPMSIEYINLMAVDGASEAGNVDFSKVAGFDGEFDPSMAITQGDEQPMGTTIDAEPEREKVPAEQQPKEAAKPAAAKKAAAPKPAAQKQPEPEPEPEPEAETGESGELSFA